jgi:hypothetical protein
MSSPSEDIKDMLLAESDLALDFAKNLFIGKETPKPDNIVMIFDYSGRPPQITMDNARYEYPSVQIRVRNNSYPNGWDLANKIYLSLHGRASETWNDSLYTVITCSSIPVFMEWDDNDRAHFIINVNLQRR